MRRFDLVEAVEVLRATPATMRAMLGGLSSGWKETTAGPDSWSPHDILGHFITGEETDWIPRARLMIAHGVSRPFEPFDRRAQFAAPQRTTEELLERFETLREENLAALDAMRIDDATMDARGVHPEFGEVRLGDMLAAWAVHDLSHIAQAAEVMAKRYADDIGPWRRYLPVVDREELSE